MYIEMNPTGLTLSDLICVAHRKRSEDTGFPYAVQSCRCSNCRYVSEGKCSLKECCCMAERVKAHTCTFTEILNTCFANVKDNVFHYRLRLAAERATMTKTCFLDREHRARFLKALHRVRGNDKSLIAQLFVLTATESLWCASEAAVARSSISCLDVDFRAFSENDYLFYCIAYDLGNGTSHTDIEAYLYHRIGCKGTVACQAERSRGGCSRRFGCGQNPLLCQAEYHAGQYQLCGA